MLLEILTRCYRRPTMLARNQASLDRMNGDNWIQTLLPDELGRGVGWSYSNMAAYAPRLVGQYIWILDDDDECVYPALIDGLDAIRRQRWPEVIWIKMNHGDGRVLPDANWQKAPVAGDIGVSAFIVRRDIWHRNAKSLLPVYAGDFHFASALWRNTSIHVWWDIVASRVQRISQGLPEA